MQESSQERGHPPLSTSAPRSAGFRPPAEQRSSAILQPTRALQACWRPCSSSPASAFYCEPDAVPKHSMSTPSPAPAAKSSATSPGSRSSSTAATPFSWGGRVRGYTLRHCTGDRGAGGRSPGQFCDPRERLMAPRKALAEQRSPSTRSSRPSAEVIHLGELGYLTMHRSEASRLHRPAMRRYERTNPILNANSILSERLEAPSWYWHGHHDHRLLAASCQRDQPGLEG